jgi:hypothetical protein
MSKQEMPESGAYDMNPVKCEELLWPEDVGMGEKKKRPGQPGLFFKFACEFVD